MAEIKQDEAVAASGTGMGDRASGTCPRIWPAVLIVLAHLSFTLATSLLASTNMQYVIGYGVAPLAAALLLLIWWLTASRVRIRERFAGLVLFIAAVVSVVLLQQSNGVLLLVIALPCLTTGVVGTLLITCWLRWPVRRWVVLAVMVGCVAVFTGMRVDSVSGNLMPIVSWRWSPTPEDLLMASRTQPDSESTGTATLPAQTSAGDWPGFRGAARDGRVPATRFSTDWSSEPPRKIWHRRVGLGWSSFTVIGDYVFTQEQRGEGELVVCYHAETGEEVWVNRVAARFEDFTGSGPRATPTFHQGRLYTLGATGLLQSLDASTGNTIWKTDLTKDAETSVPPWGFASSPLIAGDLVIVFSGAGKGRSVVAYNQVSGGLAWSAGDGDHGYSSSHLARIAEVPQILMISNFGLQSFAPETGETLWGHPWSMEKNSRVVQPLVVAADSVIIGGSFGTGTRRLRIQKEEASWSVEEVWTTRSFRPYFNDFVYHEGHCYGFDGKRFSCINATTGERRWKGPSCGGQVLLIPEMDMLLILSEAGDVVLLESTPEKYSEVARFKALTGKTWNHPAVAHGKLFVRNSKEAACFALPIVSVR